MNEINSLILQAVDTVVNARLAKQNKDITIIAQIVDNNDAMFGKYIVKYQNANLNVVCNDTSKIYKQDENVYVLIPNGNMGSSQKFILGSAKGTSASTDPYVEITDPNQRYELVGPPVFNLINTNFNTNKEWGIPGYKQYTVLPEDKMIYLTPKKKQENERYSYTNKNQLIEYSKQYEYLQFSADFKYTPADDIEKCGNYGLEIGFFVNEEDVKDMDDTIGPDAKNIIAYRFDTDSMYGDPFHPYDYTNRAVTIQCDKGLIYDLAYVTLFSEDFSRTETTPTKNDIFIKNINIQFARLRTETDDYNANIVTPYGVFIDQSLKTSEGKKCIELKPQLKYKGAVITNNVEFLWFEKDPSIDTNSETGYHPLGKRGWKQINDLTVLNKTTNTLFYTEDISSWYNKTIKLVAKYTNNIVREEQITIYQTNEQFKIDKADNPPPSEIQLNVYKKTDKGYVLLTEDGYAFKWEYIEANQYTVSLPDTDNSISVGLDEIKQHNNRKYRCYILKNENIIGIVEYLVSLSVEAQEDLQVIFELGENDNNNGTFLYDENGYISVEEFTQNRKLNFTVWLGSKQLGNATTNAYTYRWILPEGESSPGYEISTNYEPTNSMLIFLPCVIGTKEKKLQGPKADSQTPLQYKVKSSFNRNYIKNTVILEVTYNGTTKHFPYVFSFSKQGDPGTNGTDYQVRIKQTQVLTTAQAAEYEIEVYENGSKITPKEITITIDKKYCAQSLLVNSEDVLNATVSDLEKITIHKNRTLQTKEDYAKYLYNIVNLNIVLNGANGKYKIEYILPVQFYDGSSAANYFDMDNFYIVYDSAGRTPSYPNAEIKTLYSGGKDKVASIEQVIEKDKIYLINYNTEKDTIRVKNYYQSTDSVSILKAQVGTNYYYIPLVATINRFSLMHINEWDGNSVEVSTDGGYIYAPQIGAGHKDTAKNTFTGVIMGEYFIDQASKGVGLWGFDNGESSFGFNSDGTAYIGKSSVARLNFDGDEGYIENSGYAKNTSGMRIDFANGSIYAPSFTFETNHTTEGNRTLFQFDLYDNKSKFLIRAKNGTKDVDIFKATGSDENGKQQYFLKSVNYVINDDDDVTKGLKIDLVNGDLRSSQFNIDGATGNASFNGTLKAASGTFAGKLSGAEGQFSGTVYAASGQIGGWAITDTGLRGGTLTEVIETVKDDYGHEYDKITYTGTGTLLGSDGNITISGNFESTGGDINLNGITIDAATGTNPGALIFQSDDKTAKISLKGRKVVGVNADGSPDYGEDDSSHTSGAMHLTADAGIAIETDGTLYLRSKGTVDGESVFSSITMKDGQISLYPFASAVAVFG